MVIIFDDNILIDSILILSQILNVYYGDQKVFVIIDEYDAPLNSSLGETYFNKVDKTLKAMYSAGLKDNENIKKAILTENIQ